MLVEPMYTGCSEMTVLAYYHPEIYNFQKSKQALFYFSYPVFFLISTKRTLHSYHEIKFLSLLISTCLL